jgi:phage shock protein A
MMNFFTRILQVIKANINALINRFEDPERMIEQSIREMHEHVQRVRADVVNVIAEEKKLKSQVDKHQKEIERWEKNAMLAIKQGKEDLAREALRRKQESVQYVQQLQPQWEKQVEISARLKEEYHQLKNKIESAQHKKRNLIMRLKHAETQKRLQGMLTELTSGQTFDRLERKIAETEALTEAKMEVEELSLERQFEQLSSGSDLDVEQELAALKERMQLES